MSVRATRARTEPTAPTVSAATRVLARLASVENTVKITLLTALRGTELTEQSLLLVSQSITSSEYCVQTHQLLFKYVRQTSEHWSVSAFKQSGE